MLGGDTMKKSFGPKTLLMPTPVLVIGAYDIAGEANIMTAAWGGMCCSEPPCLAVSIRPERYTHGCIVKRQAFTVNIPSADHVVAADYVGIYSGRDRDKFAATKLTPAKSKFVDAPYVQEFPIVLECKVVRMIELGVHTMFVGGIVNVMADENVLGDNGQPSMPMVDPIAFAPGDGGYYRIGERLGEAFRIGKGT